jgi:hypothetical protein
MKYSWVFGILMLVAAQADANRTIAARVAAWESPVPTMSQIVQAIMRVFVSEAGFVSTADENLIYQVFGSRTRNALERNRPRRYMQVMVAYSNRTFPEWSPFVPTGLGARSNRQRWVSEITLDCTAPEHWPSHWRAWAAKPRGGLSYAEQCVNLRKRSWRLLSGQEDNWCVGRVDHWGGAMDTHNPTKGKWVRVICDKPDLVVECDEFRHTHPGKPFAWPIGCTRNIGWCDPGLGECNVPVSG